MVEQRHFLVHHDWYIMTAFLHNMIIEDERGQDEDSITRMRTLTCCRRRATRTVIHFASQSSLRYGSTGSKQTHEQLREDLVEHLEALHGGP
jgi:hypothetical protein